MLKGNLLVGENQSVALYAESLEDLLKLADSHHRSNHDAAPQSRHTCGKLRVDLAHDSLPIEVLLPASTKVPNLP